MRIQEEIGGFRARVYGYQESPQRPESTGRLRHTTLASPMTTFSAHTASPPPPSRTPAGSRTSSRYASIAPRTTSARYLPADAAPQHRTMIAAPIQCDVDGIPKGSHYVRVPPMG